MDCKGNWDEYSCVYVGGAEGRRGKRRGREGEGEGKGGEGRNKGYRGLWVDGIEKGRYRGGDKGRREIR